MFGVDCEFPASAGINRRAAERFPRRTGVPRVSGDKPKAAEIK